MSQLRRWIPFEELTYKFQAGLNNLIEILSKADSLLNKETIKTLEFYTKVLASERANLRNLIDEENGGVFYPHVYKQCLVEDNNLLGYQPAAFSSIIDKHEVRKHLFFDNDVCNRAGYNIRTRPLFSILAFYESILLDTYMEDDVYGSVLNYRLKGWELWIDSYELICFDTLTPLLEETMQRRYENLLDERDKLLESLRVLNESYESLQLKDKNTEMLVEALLRSCEESQKVIDYLIEEGRKRENFLFTETAEQMQKKVDDIVDEIHNANDANILEVKQHYEQMITAIAEQMSNMQSELTAMYVQQMAEQRELLSNKEDSLTTKIDELKTLLRTQDIKITNIKDIADAFIAVVIEVTNVWKARSNTPFLKRRIIQLGTFLVSGLIGFFGGRLSKKRV